MRYRLSVLLCIVICLAGCSASSSVIHPYKMDELSSAGISYKTTRLESFSQGQIYLKDNSAYPVENVSAGQALVFELDGKEDPVLLCKNAYQQFDPGFLVRLIAAYMVAETSDIYSDVTVTGDIFQIDKELPASGFVNGDKVSVKDLIYGSTMYGKCDCVIPLALFYSARISDYLTDLNETIKDKGLSQTAVTSIYGVPSSGQYTTIYDLYLLLPRILSNKDIYDAVTARSYECNYTSNGSANTLNMFNQLPYFCENGFNSTSGLAIIGGLCDTRDDSNSSMLVIAQTAGGKKYVAYVAGCTSYENTKTQMEIILSKILN
ncbi:MAG: hypothetical protein II688_01705 [Lachnospiraceae bacterium]|nr:hypothetical protein [Lachnospiraceae bacterium]